jgi:glutathione S-transferase
VDYIAQQRGKVARSVEALESEAGTLGQLATIGEITIACALGYLDFRYPGEPWRPGHPKLEAWYAKVLALPPLARTMPPAG